MKDNRKGGMGRKGKREEMKKVLRKRIRKEE